MRCFVGWGERGLREKEIFVLIRFLELVEGWLFL